MAEIRTERCRRELSYFLRQAWKIIEPSGFVEGWHIDALCEHLQAVSEGQIRNLLINIPPRHGKSTIVSVIWPAWDWARDPKRQFLFSAYSQRLSIRDSVLCRRLIESDWYQTSFPDVRLVSDQNEKTQFENTARGVRTATSVGAVVTGLGADIIVVDDPHNVTEASSDASRTSVIEWWSYSMSSRINDPKRSAKVIVGQRVHERDLSGHVLDVGGFEHLCLPAEWEGNSRATCIGWKDPRAQHGELLWPERFGREEIEDFKRSMGSYAASGQLQQRPAPAGGGIFKRHWWRYWQPKGANLPAVAVRDESGNIVNVRAVELPVKLTHHVQSWDCAFKDLRDSDFVVGQVWACHGANRFLLDQQRARMDLPVTINAVRRMSEAWPQTNAKYVEDKANGSAVIQCLQREITGLIPVNPEGGKIVRAQAVSPLVEAGNVYLPHPSLFPWVDAFLAEVSSFPNGKNDDQCDAMTQALNRLTRSIVRPRVMWL